MLVVDKGGQAFQARAAAGIENGQCRTLRARLMTLGQSLCDARIGAYVLALMILFLQDGVSYYVSVQMLALLTVFWLIVFLRTKIRMTGLGLASLMLFSMLLFITAMILPDTVSQNSPHIFVTTLGVFLYAVMMVAMLNLVPTQPVRILVFIKRTSTAVILLLSVLVVLSDLPVFPFLTREYFALHTASLVTNFNDLGMIVSDLDARHARGVQPDINLFYGEQSFLSLVLFVCLASYMISCQQLARLGRQVSLSFVLLSSGLACMVYIQSFSSLFYAAILAATLLRKTLKGDLSAHSRRAPLVSLLLVLVPVVVVTLWVYPYYLYRITSISSSISAQQRFGVLFSFFPQDFLFGLHDIARMPDVGFANGVIYLLMIGGVGGGCLIGYVLYRVFLLACPLRLETLSLLVTLAIFSQNGAIMSPNKMMILALIVIPLACRESQHGRKRNIVPDPLSTNE